MRIHEMFPGISGEFSYIGALYVNPEARIKAWTPFFVCFIQNSNMRIEQNALCCRMFVLPLLST